MKPAVGRWIDSHLHADLYAAGERDEMLRSSFMNGVQAVVAVSMHLESCKSNRELAARYPGRVMPAYGFHPEQPLPPADRLEELVRWIRTRHDAGEAFAIGEVGLPYYSRKDAEAKGRFFDEGPYLQLLNRFVALAAELDRPIVLHAVYDDADKACDLIGKHGVRRAHFHWFKGSFQTMAKLIAQECFISVTPDVLYEEEIMELVRRYPVELMMTETDGPWPFEGPFSGRPTMPCMVKDAAAAIARLKGHDPAETEFRLLQNADRFYGFNRLQ
ncbi:TatD family hydrolase [Paenibacillus sp. sptzw28]|uniref:TatD family hydrolase n=1 Tax=Paenibacillus sp. sptzw28 TaxID=715179 RepID=UPI001C6F0157|nr:TatD family hydrolase [Paenibacillus sp. sptzw28]QYR19836.1 TatD family hydrolase [Paenibacillus sp. sptzw28]